jgi:serine phosphatase RsbU (regulator of sigma subunit)
MTAEPRNKVNDLIDRLALKLRPELADIRGQRRIGDAADIFTLIYSIPLALLGLFWLVKLTDLKVITGNWLLLLLFAVLIYIFDRLNYFLITEIRSGGFANTEGDLDTIVMWSAIFILGPGALWLAVFLATIYFLNEYRRATSSSNRWQLWRVYVSALSVTIISSLTALWVYELLGGVIPLSNFSGEVILPAMMAFLLQFAMSVVLVSGYFLYVAWALKAYFDAPTRPFTIFFVLTFALPAMANPFSVLAAGLYAQNGLPIYLFFMAGLMMVALLARRLSMTAEFSRQQTRQLEELEKLGRALLNAPPDGSTLEEILALNVPSMFTADGILIRLESGRVLLAHPQDWTPDWHEAWDWLKNQRNAHAFTSHDKLPWRTNRDTHNALVLAPIMDAKKDQPLGGIYIELRSLSLPWDLKTILNLIPAVQSLSDQIASALHQVKVYRETLELQRTFQEISLARRIQASFLPESVPEFPGWQLAATLEPARQIAGDFYDFIPLSNGRLAILIADVADKGLGPALYMALSRTLIRTYAEQYETQPAEVLNAANRRIIHDARANLFVTVFYGVLDLSSGELIYANAGHTPPYLLCTKDGGSYTTLKNTGMPLGIDEDSLWSQEVVIISPGDILLLYTDGVTDAQNEEGEFIDRKSIIDITRRNIELSAPSLQAVILREIHAFVGSAPRFDDITLVIVGREG